MKDNTTGEGAMASHSPSLDDVLNEVREDAEYLADEVEPAGRVVATIAAVVPGLLGLWAVLEGLRLNMGTLASPGAGMWPFTVGVLVILGSVLLLVQLKMAPPCEKFTRDIVLVAIGVVTLLVFAFAIRQVGFEAITVLVLFVWMKVIGKESWFISVLVSVLATVGFYLLFIVALRVSLPHLI